MRRAFRSTTSTAFRSRCLQTPRCSSSPTRSSSSSASSRWPAPLSDLAAAERAGTIAPFLGEAEPALQRVVVTPDFHRGSGIPVGTVAEARDFVVPQAVGNDVCCGMRLLVTDITQDELAPHLDALAGPLRLRVDYRVFRLGTGARYSPSHRIYAGLNLKF